MEDDDLLAELTAAFQQGIAAPMDAAPIIGGFFGGDTVTTAETPRNVTRGSIRGGATVYYEGDESQVVRSMNEEELARFQDSLVSLGLVRDVVPGRLDDNTLRGMATLMALGNRQAVEWTTVLDGLVSSGQSVSGAEQFDPQPYMAPDYASLAQRVKGTFREALGRDPNDYEVRQLADELAGFDRMAYEREQEMRRMGFDAQVTPGTQEAGTVQSVDPLARFQELFEERYAGEINVVEDREEFVREAPRAQSIINSGVNA